MNFIKKSGLHLFFYFIPVIVAAIDIVYRFSAISQFSAGDSFFYIISIVYESIIVFFTVTALKKHSSIPSVILAIYFVIIAASYSFFAYFNTLPGMNTFSFMLSSPENSYSIAKAGINFFYVFVVLAFLSFVIWSYHKEKTKTYCMGKKGITVSIFLIILLTLVLSNNLRLKDNRTLPFTNMVFAVQHGYKDYKNNSKIVQIGSRNFILSGQHKNLNADFNVILIMNESLSPFYFKEFEGKYNTDSLLFNRIQKNPNEFFLFDKAYTSSTVTAVSVPFTLAGLNPVQGKNELIRMPLIYDYLKYHYKNVSSAYITSWSYDDYPNYKSFFNSANLDLYIYREKIHAEKVVDMGGNDTIITTRLKSFLQAKKSDKRFFSVLHYSNTHYPHYSPAAVKEFSMQNELLADYLNSLKYFDINLESVFQMLKERGELEKTIIIFTSDHSESLGEHISDKGHFGKYNIWKTKIPMWFYIPAGLQNKLPIKTLRQNTQRLVSNNDIIPTIMNLYNLPTAPVMKYGRPLFKEIEPERNILIYNGQGENRTDSKNYFGIMNETEFFIATKNDNKVDYELFAPNDDYQKTNMIADSLNNKGKYLKIMKELKIFQ